jgi:hypothetical protein
MRKKTFRVYLKHGVTLDIKADDFTVKYDNAGISSWSAPHSERWAFFLPSDIVAVERLK